MLATLFQMDPGLVEACGEAPGFVCDWVYGLTSNEDLAEFAEWFVAKPVKAIFILLLAFIVNRLARRAINRFIDRLVREREERAEERRREEADSRLALLKERAKEKAGLLTDQEERGKQRAQALGTVLRSVASLVIYTIAVMIALAEFDISLGPLVAGAGIVGIALGFGAQTLVRDFLSGIFMLIEDQYGVGDVVDLGEAAGVVEEVGLRTTRIRDVNGTVWFVPNGEIRRVGNKSQQWARAVLDVEVAYDTSINHAAAVIKGVADTVWQDQLENATVLEEPEIWGVEAFGESSIIIRLVLKVEPGEQFATAREVRKRLKIAFDEEGIEIPFPQRTVWVHEVTQESGTPSGDAEDFESHGPAEGEA
jgi:small conductance mechanosensitive channel